VKIHKAFKHAAELWSTKFHPLHPFHFHSKHADQTSYVLRLSAFITE